MKSSRPQLVLMALFFAGLVGLWLADQTGLRTSADRAKRSGRLLPDLLEARPSELARLEILGGKAPIVIRRDGDRWMIVEPVLALADRDRVEALIANLAHLHRASDPSPLDAAPSTYGLEPPERVVRLFRDDGAGPIASLEVGKAARDRRYVRPGGETSVELADARLLSALDGDPADWRDRSLFRLSSFEVARLEVTGPGPPWTILRDGGHLRIQEPILAPADPSKVEDLFAGVCGLKVAAGPEGFVAESLDRAKEYGLDPPSRTISVVSAEGKRRSIQVGASVPGHPGEVFARREGLAEVVKMDASALAPLDADPHLLRSKKLADVVPERVVSLRVEAGGIVHRLVREANRWKVVEPASAVGPADPQTVASLVSGLATAEAAELLQPDKVPARAGLETPTLRIEVWEDDPPGLGLDPGKPVAAVALGIRDRPRKVVFAKADGDSTVLMLPDSSLDLGPSGPLAFRDRAIVANRPGRMTRLVVIRENRTVALEPTGEPPDYAKWRMKAPVTGPVDRDNLAAIDVLLSGMRAETLVADSPRPEFGLDSPWMTVIWSALPVGASTPEERTLRIGAERPEGRGSRFAMVSGYPWVFALAPRSLAILLGELKDRHLVALAPDSIGSMVVSSPDRSLSFEKAAPGPGQPGGWRFGSGSEGSPEDLNRASGLATALAGLRVDHYSQYLGPIPPETGLDRPLLTVEAHLKGSPQIVKLRFGRIRPDALRFVTAEHGDSGAVGLLPNTSAEPWGGFLNVPKPELPENPFAPR